MLVLLEGEQLVADLFWNGIIISFVSGVDTLKFKLVSVFSFTRFCMLLLISFTLSTSVIVTNSESEPILWFIGNPVTAYSKDLLNLTFSTSYFL